MTNKDGRAVAHDNEVRVLRALHRFGWLRTRDIAAIVWQRWANRTPTEGPNFAPTIATPAGLRMAQRTLRRMREAHLLLKGMGPDGSTIYAIAEAGARVLRGVGVEAMSGKDLVRSFSGSHFRHRCIANEIAISGIVQGFKASTEREVSQGRWLGGDAGVAGKLPDVFLRTGSRIWWVEVERSRKNSKDYAHLIKWLEAVRRDAARPSGSELLGEPMQWAKVVFVCTPAFRAKLLKDLAAAGWGQPEIEKIALFKTSLYVFMDINFT
jgi:hypothetical protein